MGEGGIKFSTLPLYKRVPSKPEIVTPKLTSNQFQTQNSRAVKPLTKLESIPEEMWSCSAEHSKF